MVVINNLYVKHVHYRSVFTKFPCGPNSESVDTV